jgi:hypothetical protein
MNTNSSNILKDRKQILSLLWIFAMFNYLYADVLTIMDPSMLKLMIAEQGPVKMTPGFMLLAAILMETAIAMIVLSRILSYKANRIANILIGIVHTLSVAGSLFAGKPALYYLFFATIEIVCTLFIVWYAWVWPKPETLINE